MAKQNETSAADNGGQSSTWTPPVPMTYLLKLESRARNNLTESQATAIAVNLLDAQEKGVTLEDFGAKLFALPDGKPVNVTKAPVAKSPVAKALGAIDRICERAWNVFAEKALEQGNEDFPAAPTLQSRYSVTTGSNVNASTLSDAALKTVLAAVNKSKK